jgi:wyosine [tRNA(Phe)-imidazoG37] synthetase (radical SAM superfamily)
VNQRSDYFPPEDILADVKTALESAATGEIDWITFVGSGETTLHASIGRLIRQVKALTNLPVAVITNGSLLYLPELRQELSPADAVLPSLDAGTPEVYRKINRPHPEATYQRLVDGLVAFREEYQGSLWVEVMLVRGLNDSTAQLRGIKAALERIHPDEIHIVQPTRPPVETWVRPPDEGGLLRAQAILGEVANVVPPASGTFDIDGSESPVEAIISIITRHPMRESELIETLVHWTPDTVKSTLAELSSSGQAKVIERYGTRFWSAAISYFPDDKKNEKVFQINSKISPNLEEGM